MGPKLEHHSLTEVTELQQALQTSALELDLERSTRIVENVTKDEDIRKLRMQVLLLEDENEELHEQLEQEEQRSDDLGQDLNDALANSEALEAEHQRVSNELRLKTRELEAMKAELTSLHNISTDSTKLLTEKLALARELSTLKPELEHLRSQTASQQEILSEKLFLQRQLSTLQVELENEKRTVKRALAKAGKSSEQDADNEAQIEELRKDLAKEKREREKADKALQKAQADLESEKQAAQRAAIREGKDSALEAKIRAELEDLRKELSKEKREREKAEKAVQKSQTEWEAQKSILDEKLNSFRTKLKTTKEKLKETEVELQQAQATAATCAANKDDGEKRAKNSKKRGAAQIDPDAAIGTPGDGLPAKRGKRTSTVLGDKSTFSITPFLNRTASLAPDTPPKESADAATCSEGHQPNENEVAETADTPSAPPTKAAKKAPSVKAKPLTTDSSNKVKAKPAPPRKTVAVPTLEKVTEEGTEGNEENAAPADTNTAHTVMIPKLKPASLPNKQPRKSLASFATFNQEPEPEKKKKRKLLGGGLGKTLFDEDDGAALAKPIPGRGLFAARALSKGGLFGAKGAAKGGLITAEDGFQFSPLKKDRKAVATAAK